MASPRTLISSLKSPQSTRSISTVSRLLSPKSPKTPNKNVTPNRKNDNNRLSPFNVDTPNRMKILKHGVSNRNHIVLGCGGFGTVYKASYKGDEVAAKVIQRRKSSEAMMNSEKHAALLRHRNIVKVLTIEQGAALSLITMELCGKSLQDRLEETPLAKCERTRILKDIAYALQFCHNADIVHADVKPRNILISDEGQPKLTDFGHSVLMKEPDVPMSIYGTPGYAAPEALKGNIPTPSADIYSLGIVAWQMLSRTAPFSGLHVHAILYLTVKGKRPTDEELDDEFNGKYKALYRAMWSQNASSRPTLDSVIDQLIALNSK